MTKSFGVFLFLLTLSEYLSVFGLLQLLIDNEFRNKVILEKK